MTTRWRWIQKEEKWNYREDVVQGNLNNKYSSIISNNTRVLLFLIMIINSSSNQTCGYGHYSESNH